MSSFPGSPRLLKGAIVGIDPSNPVASVVIFQYNPKELKRSLDPRISEGGSSEASRLMGAPVETITLSKLEIDASDQLEIADQNAVDMGIYPQLSSLEMLIYPKSSLVMANTILLATGTMEIIAPEAPLTLFIWGPHRVVPVRITGFEITEEEFDVRLNPIRASLSLTLRVLSYNDLKVSHPGYGIFLAHQIVKEAMASIGSVSDLRRTGIEEI